MNLNTLLKDKVIALKAEVSTPNTTFYSEDEIMMLTQNFGKFLWKIGKTPRSQDVYKSENQDRRTVHKERFKGRGKKKKYYSTQKGKGIQCKECEGFGHIQAECGNTLKKNRSLNTTLNNEGKKEESDCDDEDDTDSNETITFNVVVNLKERSLHDNNSSASDQDSLYSDEEVSYEELLEKYDLMHTKWIDLV